MWTLKKYTCLQDLERLAPQWQELHESSQRPDISLNPDWIISWYKAFGSNLEPHVLGIYKNEKLVLVAPLHASVQTFRLTSLEALHSIANGYSPSGGVVLSAELSRSDVQTATQLLLADSDFELCRIYKLPEKEAASVCALATQSGLLHSGMEATMSTPMIELVGDWQDYLSTRSRSHRKSMRRKSKRIGEHKVEVEIGTPQSRDDPFLDEMFKISAKSWKHSEGTDLQSDGMARNFVYGLVERFGQFGKVKVWLLKVDGVAIAYELHIQSGSSLYPIRADYDLDFAHLSPGQVLLQMVLEALFKDPSARIYDCCADDYEYLKSWAHYSIEFYTVDVFSTKLKPSLVYLAKYHVLPTYRRFRQHLQDAA